MQSFIIAHQDKDKRDEYIETFLNKEMISSFDTIRLIGESSLGIEEIRLMQKSVFLTPVKGNKKAIILENAQTLTPEAQNALLKLLEEPPAHAIFLLSTTTSDSLMPTILSRCSIITLQPTPVTLTPEESANYDADIALLLSDSISQRLSLAEKVAAQKDTAASWLKNFIVYLRVIMLEDIENKTHLASILTHLQEAYRLITTTNTNPRILLEHSFLSY